MHPKRQQMATQVVGFYHPHSNGDLDWYPGYWLQVGPQECFRHMKSVSLYVSIGPGQSQEPDQLPYSPTSSAGLTGPGQRARPKSGARMFPTWLGGGAQALEHLPIIPCFSQAITRKQDQSGKPRTWTSVCIGCWLCQ